MLGPKFIVMFFISGILFLLNMFSLPFKNLLLPLVQECAQLVAGSLIIFFRQDHILPPYSLPMESLF